MDSESRRRIERRIASATASHMSNAKWRKLLEVLADPANEVGLIRWKFIGDARVFETRVPDKSHLLEDSFGDCLPYPYGEYKEIEYVEIPSSYADPRSDPKRPLPDQTHNLQLIQERIARLGMYPIEMSQERMRIVGYTFP